MSKLPTPNLLRSMLTDHRVWTHCSAEWQQKLLAGWVVESVEADATLLHHAERPGRTGMVISGEVHLIDADLGTTLQLGQGELFGFAIGPVDQQIGWLAQATVASEIAWLDAALVTALCQSQPALRFFFPSIVEPSGAQVSATASNGVTPQSSLLSTPVSALVKRAPITLAPETSIQAAAQLMGEGRVSSVLLAVDGKLVGVVTDRDMRNRVVAQNLAPHRPISDIATPNPLHVSHNSPAFEALLLMARHNIHHLPVMDGERIVGMITNTDLTEQHTTSAIYIVGDIDKQTSLDGLTRISGRVKQLQQSLAAADASAYSTGHIVTAITDAITKRLIHLAHVAFGPTPVPYAWVAAGSQARNEQTAKSDQDNCLILDDSYDPALHGDYFRNFSKFVCDGLAACGYIHCPGEMMAMTDMWRQPRKVWADYFRKWIYQPQPMALMLTCVFFDLRVIHGAAHLLESLRHDVLVHTKGNSLFLAHMVGNALKHRPPLSLFGNINLIRGGENANTLDLKHSAIVPIVDLARVYALSAGVSIANTSDRLESSAQAGEVTARSAHDLRDALEFLGKLRIAHQARQMQLGTAPDNFLRLEVLSNFERSQLKNAFNVVQTLQDVLHQRYSAGRF